MNRILLIVMPLLLAVGLLAVAWDDISPAAPPAQDGHAAAATDYERGPHRGRMLRSGDFAVEITIFEEGVPPRFRVFPYLKGKPIAPMDIMLTMALTRLGGQVDRFTFETEGDRLNGKGVVHEPHSFDVAVTAELNGAKHAWTYASYEGRTTIGAAAAEAAGVKVEPAGPATIEDVIDIAGRISLQPQAHTEVRAWYPGRIVAMTKTPGETVRRGEALARVEASESLQIYVIPAPMAGVVVERRANVGEVASTQPLYVLADAGQLRAEFFVYPRDMERVREGQIVEIRSLTGERKATARIAAILPTTDSLTQTVTIQALLPATSSGWRPGMSVEGALTVGQQPVPLAVRTRGLQRFRDFMVVFAQVGETYEVRMLELGRRSSEWTEVLGGLAPGEVYVTDNAFLIRADVEKSGASHDH